MGGSPRKTDQDTARRAASTMFVMASMEMSAAKRSVTRSACGHSPSSSLRRPTGRLGRAATRFGGYDFLQVQAEPQPQLLPHWQPLRLSVLAAWQPQVQPVPGQDSHAQPLVLFVMTRSSCLG
jgi:hypothetical protein